MGFLKLKSSAVIDNAATGAAIIKVSKSAFQNTPGSEWVKFDGDTRKWLFDNGYIDPATGDGKVPAGVDIVPVYDTPTKMHIRVPWIGDLENAPAPLDEPTYGGNFPAFLARYFIRRCR